MHPAPCTCGHSPRFVQRRFHDRDAYETSYAWYECACGKRIPAATTRHADHFEWLTTQWNRMIARLRAVARASVSV
mgnify:CR=1